MPADKRHVRQDTIENCVAQNVQERPASVAPAFESLKQLVGGHRSNQPPVQDLQTIYEYILGLEQFIIGAYRVKTVQPHMIMPSDKALRGLRESMKNIK